MSKRPRFAALALLLTVLTGLLIGCGGSAKETAKPAAEAPKAEAKKPIKVGAVFILSGGNSGYGIAQRAGVELARDEINKAGGINGAQLEVIFEDSQGNKDLAINAFRKLIDKDEVTALIGPTLSTEMFGAGPVAQQSAIPALGISNTVNGITDIGNYIFRNSLPEAAILPYTVKQAIAKYSLKKVAVMWASNDDFSNGGYTIFKQELAKNNIAITTEASFNVKDTEFGAQLTKVLATNPDGIVLSALYQEAALVMVQARKMGYKGPFIGGNGFNSPALLEVAKEAADGAIVGSPWFPGRDDPKAKKFVADFTAKTGKAPDQFAAQAFDGMYLMATAIKNANSTNRDKVRDALAAIKNLEGVTGKFSFDANRNPDMAPTILIIKGGAYTELK
ncbi:MAG TPA: ABC transporter substrate-binding protein [Symbiobacteriaceae bacterium]|jgi:branched-chain amino acid transport system substrate-binding protein